MGEIHNSIANWSNGWYSSLPIERQRSEAHAVRGQRRGHRWFHSCKPFQHHWRNGFTEIQSFESWGYEKQESTGCDGPEDAQEDETDERSSISQVGEEDRQEGENGHDFWSHYFPEEHDGIYSLGWLICRLPADVRRLQVAKMENLMYTSGITRESDKSFILECD